MLSAPRCSTASTRAGWPPCDDEMDVLGAHADLPVADRDHVHWRRPDESRGKSRRRPQIQFLRRSILFYSSVAHQDHAIRHGHGLGLIVRHVDHCHSEPLLQRADFSAHFVAQLRIEVGKRLVHQAYLATSAMMARPSATRCRWPPENCEGLRSRRCDSPTISATRFSRVSRSASRHPPHAEAEDDVFSNVQMRKQRV